MTEGSYTNTNFHVRITLNCNLNLNLLICFWMKGLIFCLVKYIGIIVAEIEELEAIKSLMYNIEEVHIYNLNIFKGKISNKDCLLVRCGVGKVNASRITQILTDNFKLEFIINLGSAGSLNNDLNIGDIVIAKNLVQHDFDVTAFGRDKGYIPDTGMFFECDTNLLQRCMSIKINDICISTGIIASGDIFCTDVKMKETINKKFRADCVEMEGAAIAQVCHLNNIPFVVVRSISDTPNGNNQVDFNEYLRFASKNCGIFTKKLFALLI